MATINFPNKATISLHDFGFLLRQAPDHSVSLNNLWFIPQNSSSVIPKPVMNFSIGQIALANKEYRFEVKELNEPINICYFIDFQTHEPSYLQGIRDDIVRKVNNKEIESLEHPTLEKVSEIFLTRCSHLIHRNSCPNPTEGSCPVCSQELSKEKPFLLQPIHFSVRGEQRLPQKVSLLHDAYILSSLIPPNTLISCPLSQKTINLTIDEEEKINSFVATPCGSACDKEAFLEKWKENGHKCPFCNENHEIDPIAFNTQDVEAKITSLPHLKNKTIIRLDKSIFTDPKYSHEIISCPSETLEPCQFHLEKIFPNPDPARSVDLAKDPQEKPTLEEFLITPCCKTFIHETVWEKWKETKYEKKKISLFTSFTPPSINCVCGKKIPCRDYLNDKEKKILTFNKWFFRITAVALAAISLSAIVAAIVAISLGDILIRSLFPFAAAGFGWETEVVSLAGKGLSLVFQLA